MDKLNLTATINLQRPDKKGRCQVRIRSTIKRKITYFPTGLSVLPSQFYKGEIIKHPNKLIFNTLIRTRIAEIEKNYIEGNLSIRSSTITFYEYCTKKIEATKNKDAKGTWKHKKSYLTKINKFKSVFYFKDITPAFMLSFENYCRELGNQPNTIWGSVKFIKTMVNCAIVDGIISVNPMKGYKGIVYVNPQRQYLTEDEIDRMEKFSLETPSKTLSKVANWFLFASYSGLRYNDVKNFNKSYIVNGRILLRTEKSKTDVSIKIHPRLQKVLDRMSPNVFTNQKMNDYLKLIAERCNINKTITFHCSRHSFSVMFLNKGGSMEALSKILGHSNIRTTSIYGKITNLRLDNEIDKVFS